MTQAIIQPGALFKQIKPILDSKNTNYPTGLGIAHGTCQSVAIAGYTMGGGWGPWTRLHGMGCERLAGATIVLGDGSIRYLGTSAIYHNENSQYNDEQNNNLLWAIRGGGGLSYGIVTEFFFIPFKLPEFPTSFVIKSTDFITKIKAIDIIAAWEKVIEPHNNPHLIGTNLQVIAKGVACDEDVSDDAVLDWQFNGHFGGTRGEFEKMINDWAESVIIRINNNPYYDDAQKYVMIKDIKQEVVKILNPSNINIQTSVTVKNTQGYPFIFESWDRRLNNGLSLEVDCPAPHKLTSRMPTPKWDETSRKQLVRSLQSTLLNVNKCEPSNFSATDDKDTSIEAYITLGAISGKFYAEKQNLPEPERIKISFPYQDRAFTIQYQAWWNQSSGKYCEMSPETKEQKIPTRFHENRAQDWIETCREFHIPHTSGSFISFKDASVPTKDYFSDNYQALINTKLTSSKDEKCLLRSRKTII
ncbi:hypothetical protein CJF42_00355 [Pseudoalteromonas sp. NBT06-2]|nr:hypothetical protein CJF42_00355 [Pseudoalteromonas sp. NBT06-2]